MMTKERAREAHKRNAIEILKDALEAVNGYAPAFEDVDLLAATEDYSVIVAQVGRKEYTLTHCYKLNGEDIYDALTEYYERELGE